MINSRIGFIALLLGMLLLWFVVVFPALAVGVDGQRRDGTMDYEAVRKSRPAKMTVLSCGRGRTRAVRNHVNKCAQKTKKRFRNTRARKSLILQKYAPKKVYVNRRNIETSAPTVGGYWFNREFKPFKKMDRSKLKRRRNTYN